MWLTISICALWMRKINGKHTNFAASCYLWSFYHCIRLEDYRKQIFIQEPERSVLFPFRTTPFKKSNATRLWSIIFLLSWICIHQVRYPWKACLFAFQLMPYLLGLFYWGVCRVSKLGAMSKRKSFKIYQIVWEMHTMSSFVLPFCERMHTYPLPIRCTEILWKNTSCWISNSGAILEHLFFDIVSNIITLRTFLPGIITNNVPIERKINRLSDDT